MAQTAVVDARVVQDAEEFGRHITVGGWRLGLLVARNVHPGTRGRESGAVKSSRDDLGKVSLAEFARYAATGDHRVKRYYLAWNLAVTDGIVKPPDDITLGEEPSLPDDDRQPWSDYYDKVLHVKNERSEGGDVKNINLDALGADVPAIDKAVELAKQGLSYRQIGPLVGLDESSVRRNDAVRQARTKADPNAHSITVDRPTVACYIPPAREEIQRVEFKLADLVNPEKYVLSKPDAKRLLKAVRTVEKELERILDA